MSTKSPLVILCASLAGLPAGKQRVETFLLPWLCHRSLLLPSRWPLCPPGGGAALSMPLELDSWEPALKSGSLPKPAPVGIGSENGAMIPVLFSALSPATGPLPYYSWVSSPWAARGPPPLHTQASACLTHGSPPPIRTGICLPNSWVSAPNTHRHLPA